MTIPENLKFSQDHEWIRVEKDCAYVGISEHAAKELGDIVFLDIDTIGDTVEAGERFGSIEAVKTEVDLLIPVTGEVLEMNSELEDHPELVNNDPYGEGWIIKITVDNPEELDGLMNAAAYQAFI